jgi:RimJ/RimL family protein N-acetyltransferase
MNATVREMKESDVQYVVDYFVNADPAYLKGMGADKNKLPGRVEWIAKVVEELNKPFKVKELYYIIWEIDGKPFGHSNINNIEYGKSGTMHLHIWNKNNRRNGNGLNLLKQTIPYYFNNFELEKLICEPYALNPAPTKVLKNIGFEFVRTYDTIPGTICFLQTVIRYEMSRDRFYEVNHVNGHIT